MSTALPQFDVLIAGAGIIGLTLALELHSRGAHVCVIDTQAAMRQASIAAAGMLAAEDPHNPAALLPLTHHSLSLYPSFLERITNLSGHAVPFQTDTTLQYADNGAVTPLTEHSLDPRQLGAAVLTAVQRTSIVLREHTSHIEEVAHARVHTSGAWFAEQPFITPRKGQMLRVHLPASLQLTEVHRNASVYVVPRTSGPQAGTAIIGATIEDAGFDLQTHRTDLAHLRALAATLVPACARLDQTPELESWAGLRPATADGLPLLGPLGNSPREYVATGHFRNGILLAPATAVVMVDLIEGKHPAVDLSAF